jgi:competence protein ComEC
MGSLWSTLLPDFAALLLQIGALGLNFSLWIGAKINTIPHLSLWLQTPPIWKIIVFYASFILLFIIPNRKNMLVFTGCLTLLLLPQIRETHTDQITIIDVGKGNSSLIELTSGETILIDCGGPDGNSFNIGRQVIAPFLWQRRIQTLDLLVLSHPDLDHYSGALFIIEHFKLKELWIPNIKSDNDRWQAIIATAKKQQVKIRIPNQNETFPLAPPHSLRNLSNAHKTRPTWSQNNQSLVIRLSTASHSFLFPGDIANKGEALLLLQNIPIESTVLVAPHHGSKSSSSMSFIKKVHPKYTVFSASKYGHTPFPAPATVKRYKSLNSHLLKTANLGAIIFESKDKQLIISTTALPD